MAFRDRSFWTLRSPGGISQTQLDTVVVVEMTIPAGTTALKAEIPRPPAKAAEAMSSSILVRTGLVE